MRSMMIRPGLSGSQQQFHRIHERPNNRHRVRSVRRWAQTHLDNATCRLGQPLSIHVVTRPLRGRNVGYSGLRWRQLTRRTGAFVTSPAQPGLTPTVTHCGLGHTLAAKSAARTGPNASAVAILLGPPAAVVLLIIGLLLSWPGWLTVSTCLLGPSAALLIALTAMEGIAAYQQRSQRQVTRRRLRQWCAPRDPPATNSRPNPSLPTPAAQRGRWFTADLAGNRTIASPAARGLNHGSKAPWRGGY